MARTKISEFSPTPASNTDIDGINIAENCPPSGINDAIRELMAQLKDFQAGTAGDSFNGPIGSTTAVTGAFTNITASGTLGVTGVATLGNGAVLGTPASVTLTNGTGLPIATGVSGLGTGVATALAVNVGSAGAPVVNGGALGTPSSGTVTNLTGTASININGTVGATTANTGAFTTLAASGTVTLSGGTANGVAYLNGSKVLTTGSALTFDGSQVSIKPASGFQPLKVSGTGGSIDTFFYVDTAYWGWSDATGLGGNAFGGHKTNNYLFWQINGSEQMRLTSTGLGIGTSSPSYKLQIANTAASAFASIVSVNTGTAGLLLGDTDSATVGRVEYDNAGNFMALYTNSTEKLRLDSSGNLGLGVTPSAWLGAYKALQFTGGAVQGGTAGLFELYANNFRDGNGNFIYSTTNPAARYTMSDAHRWYTAPSGTAGNAISFTQALSLTAAGNLLLGGTTDPGGTKVLYIGNGTTPGTPTSGGVLYVESGALKYKGSSGTVTTLGAA